MKHPMIGKTWKSILFFVLAVAVLYALPPAAHIHEGQPRDGAPPPPGSKSGHPKIESALFDLIEMERLQGTEAMKAHAGLMDIDMLGDFVRVVVETEMPAEARGRAAVAAATLPVQNRLESLGGRVETHYENLIQGLARLGTLESLAETPHVRFIRLPLKAFPQRLVSEGVTTTRANAWHGLAPYRTSREVKICILDAGFTGYEALLGTDLPRNVVTRSFRADGNLFASPHGTACAEIVHDMVPNASLYLANFSTSVEHGRAIDWIIEQGIDIVSYSMGWYNAGAGDGTGPITEQVKKAVDAGVVWVSAAGNSARDHWTGMFSDTSGNQWHNFTAANAFLYWQTPAYTPVSAFLRWNDWGPWDGRQYRGSDQDYDLYLYVWDGSAWVFVASSRNLQTGTQWPVESISGWYSTQERFWGIAIRRDNATRNVLFNLHIRGNSGAILYNEPAGSLVVPADSPHVLTAGASDWATNAYHAYSSRGPTADGRIKPDFSAPAGTSGATYGPRSFIGTSAATPHLAGAFGLILEKTPFSADQIRALLEDRALDLGPPGKDNQFGIGSVRLIKE